MPCHALLGRDHVAEHTAGTAGKGTGGSQATAPRWQKTAWCSFPRAGMSLQGWELLVCGLQSPPSAVGSITAGATLQGMATSPSTRLLQNPAPHGVCEAPEHLSTHPARGQPGGSSTASSLSLCEQHFPLIKGKLQRAVPARASPVLQWEEGQAWRPPMSPQNPPGR